LWAKWPFVKRKVRAGVERLHKMKQGRQEKHRAAFRQACVDAGMATRDDMEKRLLAPAQPGKIPAGPLKAVECYGLLFYLSLRCESIYLGKTQPSSLNPETINMLIDGPFCPECRHEMTWSDDRQAHLVNKCLFCEHVWSKSSIVPTTTLADLKKYVYKELDAAFRKDGRLGNKVG